MSFFGQPTVIQWKLSDKKPPKKIRMLDECSHGQLWLCELYAETFSFGALTGGLIKWFFHNPTIRRATKIFKKWGRSSGVSACSNCLVAVSLFILFLNG